MAQSIIKDGQQEDVTILNAASFQSDDESWIDVAVLEVNSKQPNVKFSELRIRDKSDKPTLSSDVDDEDPDTPKIHESWFKPVLRLNGEQRIKD